ncbi:MAG: hypothetical protein CMM44_04935 [Rhodospirillaceae bacterium]|nr:hypothetical protein [Rhodospirillaceae bacterium]
MANTKTSPVEKDLVSEALELCRQDCRVKDPDRYFSTLFSSPTVRTALWTLYAFNAEIASVRESVSEPMIGHIKFQWWREAILDINSVKGKTHHLQLAISDLTQKFDFPISELILLIDFRESDLEETPPLDLKALYAYAHGTAGKLAELVFNILCPDKIQDRNSAINIGTAWGLTGLVKAAPYHLQQGKNFFPNMPNTTTPYIDGAETISSVLDFASDLIKVRISQKYRPLSVLVPLIEDDIKILRSLLGTAHNFPSCNIFTRQWKMCKKAWFNI